ncbi:MAG TPA: DUF6515 family protein [Hanamia sp.]|nr:DUF6515 family protein [Hanamia sp.]
MKKIIKIFILTSLSVGLLNSVEAQRGRDSRGGGGGNEGRPSRSFSRSSAPVRNMTYRQSAPQRSFNSNRSTIVRNNSMRNSYRGNVVARSPQRNTNVYNTRTTVLSRNNYAMQRGSYRGGYSNRYVYHNYYGNVYGHRTSFMYGTRYRFIPRSFISIRFGGYPYYYHSGFYYGYYDGFYQPVFPPFGLRIGILPFGYSSFYWGGYPYYYYNGIYYQNYGNDGYQVVDAPMGATVSSLPGGATSVVVNGETLYELNGTYYKAGQDANGNTIFTVVGKNGVINNTPDYQNNNGTTDNGASQFQGDDSQQQYPATNAAPSNVAPSNVPPSNVAPPNTSTLQIGDTMAQLPNGSKLVDINGEQLYQTPDNVYLKGELNNGVVQFKVVGK